MKCANFGSVSSGTLRDQDLLEAFASELDYQLSRQSKRFARKAYRQLIREANRAIADDTDPHGFASEGLVDELQDALNTFAPAYSYFGAHCGDGADFGYWLSESVEHDFDGLKVDDTADVPRGYRGEVLHVSDHGNLTLYVANGRGKLREVWGIV